MYVNVTCGVCQETFSAKLSEIHRGNGKYCSRKCSSKSRPHKELNAICSFCGGKFLKSPSKIKRSKSGLLFCSREHKDAAQRIVNGFIQLHPSHYGTGTSDYRNIALDHYGLWCQKCENSFPEEILEVHHKDKNRKNNELSNLEVLCCNCHASKHRIR